jgi:hypothetical protein
MALIVEDGSGRVDAESYLSVAAADTYHAAFGNSAWTGAEVAVKEAALRRATQYLDARYAWAGEPLTQTQALAWPRVIADLPFAKYAWPVKRVCDACAELALRALSGALFTDQLDAQIKSERVGPIEVEYATGANGGQTRFAVVDDLLRDLTRGAGRLTLRVERAS